MWVALTIDPNGYHKDVGPHLDHDRSEEGLMQGQKQPLGRGPGPESWKTQRRGQDLTSLE